jgi:hypothetical protein
MQIQGKLIQVTTPENGTSKAGKDWVKCQAIIETDGQYPKKIAITLMKEALIIEIASKRLGEVVSLECNAESRESNGKWYTDIQAWRVN